MGNSRIWLGLALIACTALIGGWLALRDRDVELPVVGVDIDSEPSLPVAQDDPAFTRETSTTYAELTALGTVRGRVIDAVTKAPVPSFTIEMIEAREVRRGTPTEARVFKSNDGAFEWKGIRPGHWSLFASAPGYQRFELSDLTVRAEIMRPVTLPLRAGYTLTGRVYDRASGIGIDSASIHIRDATVGRFDGNWRSRPQVMSDAQGLFKIQGLALGQVILEVYAPDHAAREVMATVGGSRTFRWKSRCPQAA